MQEHIGLLVAAARRRIKQAVVARAAAWRLTSQQFWFLLAVVERPGISQAELAGRVRADAPTASRVVASLARRRLVRTEVDPGDRRRTLVFPTPSGDALGRELAPVARSIRAAVVEGMTEAEIAATRAGLSRIVANLDRLVAAPPPQQRGRS